MHRIKANDLEIAYRIDGSGPETIVLVTGLADRLFREQRGAAPAQLHAIETHDNRGRLGAVTCPAMTLAGAGDRR